MILSLDQAGFSVEEVAHCVDRTAGEVKTVLRDKQGPTRAEALDDFAIPATGPSQNL